MPRRGGGMGPGTIAALEALLASIAMLPGALFCSATDANGPGDRFADRHRSLAEKFSVPFARLRPPIEGGDWNDVLRARSERRIGAMSALTLAAANINSIPEDLRHSPSPPPVAALTFAIPT